MITTLITPSKYPEILIQKIPIVWHKIAILVYANKVKQVIKIKNFKVFKN
jgi:hypothetical protein